MTTHARWAWRHAGPGALLSLVVACEGPVDPSRAPVVPHVPASGAEASAAIEVVVLPALSGRVGEALAVSSAGTVVAGHSWESGPTGTLRAVRWKLGANGSWSLAALPQPATATGATARGTDAAGTVAGTFFPDATGRAARWPAGGGFSVLGCAETGRAQVQGISGDGQTVIGRWSTSFSTLSSAALWRPTGCRQTLPRLAAGAYAVAEAVNGNGTVVGGHAAPAPGSRGIPVRWTRVAGVWQITVLDQRPGLVLGSNTVGDLAGYVVVPQDGVSCLIAGGCRRGRVWYLSGTTRALGTPDGPEVIPRDINADGEVVGMVQSDGSATGFFWSVTSGTILLPSRGAGAYALSDVRADGSRLVAGANSRGAAVWVIRSPP